MQTPKHKKKNKHVFQETSIESQNGIFQSDHKNNTRRNTSILWTEISWQSNYNSVSSDQSLKGFKRVFVRVVLILGSAIQDYE